MLTGSAFTDDNGNLRARDYTVYITNPSPFSFVTSRIQVWVIVPDHSKALAIPEEIPRTVVPAHQPQATIVHFQDLALDLHDVVGSSIECDGVAK